MNRHWIIICKTTDLDEVAPLRRLWYAESNSPNERLALSGRPEVKEAVKIFLNALPPTYDRLSAKELLQECIDEVYCPEREEE